MTSLSVVLLNNIFAKTRDFKSLLSREGVALEKNEKKGLPRESYEDSEYHKRFVFILFHR